MQYRRAVATNSAGGCCFVVYVDTVVTTLKEIQQAIDCDFYYKSGWFIGWSVFSAHPFWAVVNKSNAVLMGLLCRWPSITEWEMYITAQGPCLRNDLYCVEWDGKL